jgi:hypothetical protein
LSAPEMCNCATSTMTRNRVRGRILNMRGITTMWYKVTSTSKTSQHPTFCQSKFQCSQQPTSWMITMKATWS